MAENKKSIIVYADWIDKFEECTDDEAGRLIKHFFRYVNDLNPEAPDRITKLLFTDIKNTLKRDLNKYEDKKTERSRSGKLGNLKKYNKDLYDDVVSNNLTLEEALAMAKYRKESLSEKIVAKLAVSDSDSDSDSVTLIKENSEIVEDRIIEDSFFIENFNKARYHKPFKLNLPMNIKTGEPIEIKLNSVDKTRLRELRKEGYTNQDGKDAILGLMNSNTDNQLKKTPTHVLGEAQFNKYLDSARSGQKVIYNFKKPIKNEL